MSDSTDIKKPTPIRFYEREYPETGDLVVFKYGKMEDEKLVHVTLPEYLNRGACILLKELTRSKRVRSYQRLCPTGQLGVGEVLSTENDGEYIFLSVRTLGKGDKDRYMDWFSKSKRLLGFMRKISLGSGMDIQTVCSRISWPLLAGNHDDAEIRYVRHPLDMIDHPKKLATKSDYFISLLGQDNLALLEEWHEPFFGKPTYEKVFKFGLMSYQVDGCEDIKSTLNSISEKIKQSFPDIKQSISLRDQPIYELKLSGLDEEQLDEIVSRTMDDLTSSGLIFRPF